MGTYLPSFNSLLKLHVSVLSIEEQLGLAATFLHSKCFFILSEQTEKLKICLFVCFPQEMELCHSVLCKI